MTVLTTLMQLVSTDPPQKNYEGVETRKKIALYENIKFYDYIP